MDMKVKYKNIVVHKNDYEEAKEVLRDEGIYPKRGRFVFDVNTAIVTGIVVTLVVVLMSSLIGGQM